MNRWVLSLDLKTGASRCFGWLVQSVPELRRRAAESSARRGAEAGGGHSEVDGGGSEGRGWGAHVEEIGHIWRAKGADGLQGEEEEFEVDALLDWEPVDIL